MRKKDLAEARNLQKIREHLKCFAPYLEFLIGQGSLDYQKSRIIIRFKNIRLANELARKMDLLEAAMRKSKLKDLPRFFLEIPMKRKKRSIS